VPITASGSRSRRDRCPGVLRPWPAADGALVRLRLVGGRITAGALAGLSGLAQAYGDGDVHLTGRANLQLRGLPAEEGLLPAGVVTGIERLGLLPSREHERVRNIMVSPQSGLAGGRADLRPYAAALDEGLRSDPVLAGLPGRFLFVLDDGRGDLIGRESDLALIALSADEAQLRVGDDWADRLGLDEAVARLLGLARDFEAARGSGRASPWHVRELAAPLVPAATADPRADVRAEPLAYGCVPGGEHVAAPAGLLSPDLVHALTDPLPDDHDLVVTPWRGVLVPTHRGDR